MQPAEKSSLPRRLLVWGSWFALVVAMLVALATLASKWAVNAEHLGAHNMGQAILFASVSAVGLVGSLYALPVLVVLGGLSLVFERRAGLRYFAAAAACAAPLVLFTWLN